MCGSEEGGGDGLGNRRLSSEASAELGRWRTSRAEYQPGIMEAISDGAAETVVIMSSSQVGKALALDTPIPTPGGWTTMGEIRVGDVIFDERGRSCRVTVATGVMMDRPCYKTRNLVERCFNRIKDWRSWSLRTFRCPGPSSLPHTSPQSSSGTYEPTP